MRKPPLLQAVAVAVAALGLAACANTDWAKLPPDPGPMPVALLSPAQVGEGVAPGPIQVDGAEAMAYVRIEGAN